MPMCLKQEEEFDDLSIHGVQFRDGKESLNIRLKIQRANLPVVIDPAANWPVHHEQIRVAKRSGHARNGMYRRTHLNCSDR